LAPPSWVAAFPAALFEATSDIALVLLLPLDPSVEVLAPEAPLAAHLEAWDFPLLCKAVDGLLGDLEIFGNVPDCQDVFAHVLTILLAKPFKIVYDVPNYSKAQPVFCENPVRTLIFMIWALGAKSFSGE
jgi:hypothetical protein